MFNNALWPDFTTIPSSKNPVFKIKPFKAGSSFKVGKYDVRTVPVTHPVESCGFVVSNGKTAVAMSGDTGPTDKLWDLLNATKNLKAVLLEASFPNSCRGSRTSAGTSRRTPCAASSPSSTSATARR